MKIWKPVPGFDNLEASSDGEIRKILKPIIKVRDYLCVLVCKNKSVLLHRLVASAFHGPPPNAKSECMHLDGDPQNNIPSNLRWGSHLENMNMDRGNNHSHKNESNPNSKLTKEQVAEIRKAYDQRNSSKWGRRKFAEKFNISEIQILRVAQRKYGGWNE